MGSTLPASTLLPPVAAGAWAGDVRDNVAPLSEQRSVRREVLEGPDPLSGELYAEDMADLATPESVP